MIAPFAMTGSREGLRAFELYGQEKFIFYEDLSFENSIPSQDTLAHIFTLIGPKQFSRILKIWTEGLQATMNEIKYIAFDEKTLRGSFEGGKNNSGAHVVEARASDIRLVLTQNSAL